MSLSLSVFAQGVFEGSGEEENSNCVGDGCGLDIWENQENNAQKIDSVQNDTVSNVEQVPQDSAADTTKYAELFDDEEDTRPDYIVSSSEEYRARKEGFSKSIQFGFRAGAGVNMQLLGNETDGWNPGLDFEVGAVAKLPLGNDFLAAAGLDFSYRTYSYEADTDYGTNEASISEMLFEIPVFIQYNITDDGLFVGIGGNIGLKMHGETEFKQTIDTKDKHYKDKRNNTMPTVGVELGGLLDIGYIINKNFTIDLRLVQNATKLLDLDVIAESSLMKTKLFTTHATLGITFLL